MSSENRLRGRGEKKAVKRLREMYTIRSKKLKEIVLCSLGSIMEQVDAFSNDQQFFISSRFRLKEESVQERRWELKEKLLALPLWKYSPKGYALLSKILTLPSKQVLNNLLSTVPLESGINEDLFLKLESVGSKMEPPAKFCILMFDEMSIRRGVSYDAGLDCFVGFSNTETSSGDKELAKSVLVFMLQSVTTTKKYPIAYFFCGKLDSVNLGMLVKTIITKLYAIGFLVVATVCDMGANNVAGLDSLRDLKSNCYFTVDGRRIFTIFDPPNLLKCTRNMFVKYDIGFKVPSNGQVKVLTAKLEHVRSAYNIDLNCSTNFRSMCKLSESHFAPGLKPMKVSFAAELMSYTVAGAVMTYILSRNLSEDALGTVEFIKNVNDIFDSLNGGNAASAGSYKGLVTNTSSHHNFWTESLKFILSWQYFQSNGSVFYPPSKTGWIITLKAVRGLWKFLFSEGLSQLATGRLNLDSLKIFFSSVRGACGGNLNPSALQFISAYKTCVINNITRIRCMKGNVEHDNQSFLSDSSVLLRNVHNDNNTSETLFGNASSSTAHTVEDEVLTNNVVFRSYQHFFKDLPTVEKLSNIEMAAIVVNKVLRKINCQLCSDIMLSPHQLESDWLQFVELRKIFPDGNVDFRFPSEPLTNVISHSFRVSDELLPRITSKVFQTSRARIAEQVDYSCLCSTHHDVVKNELIKEIVLISIHLYCLKLNSSL